MPRAGHVTHLLMAVDDREQTGRRPVHPGPFHRPVEPLQNPVRRKVVLGQQPQQRPVVAHRDGGFHTVPHHIAHRLQMTPIAQRNDVEPVTAHQRALLGRPIAGRDLHMRLRPPRLGEQRVLELAGDGVLVRETPRVVQVDGSPDRQFTGDHDILALRERRPPFSPYESQHTQRTPARGQRHDDRRVQTDRAGGGGTLEGERVAARLSSLQKSSTTGPFAARQRATAEPSG